MPSGREWELVGKDDFQIPRHTPLLYDLHLLIEARKIWEARLHAVHRALIQAVVDEPLGTRQHRLVYECAWGSESG